jgi:hypothetical protein
MRSVQRPRGTRTTGLEEAWTRPPAWSQQLVTPLRERSCRRHVAPCIRLCLSCWRRDDQARRLRVNGLKRWRLRDDVVVRWLEMGLRQHGRPGFPAACQRCGPELVVAGLQDLEKVYFWSSNYRVSPFLSLNFKIGQTSLSIFETAQI